ncbi:PP2C family protein-serine/threonine phosphatase [Nocardia sp. NBC_01388]|uniref:PP2C family protein-serine/threonine phosphatase n=1 Tax=Nocardia sp. NBC_01388 TaxID=2903596 RepID=UPI0032452B65
MTTTKDDELSDACPVCGITFEIGDRFCEDCGYALTGEVTVLAADRREVDLGSCAAVTDRGKRHAHNEDAMALRLLTESQTRVLVVSDGVSSSDRADEAAERAAATTADRLTEELRDGTHPAIAIVTAMAQAAAAVAALGDSGDRSPACTLVSAVLTAEAITLGWVGDSRAYWLAAGDSARCLTDDDSVAAGLIAHGVDAETAMASPGAHTLTAWLGADADALEPHVRSFVPDGPGLLLLCSDGLWNYFPAADTLSDLAAPAARTAPLTTAHNLADLALAAGGGDNITVAVAPFPSNPRNC